MAGEYWAGWFDVWGEPHHTQILEKMMADLGWMLDRGYSFNLYMVHGGTTFGWMGGARMRAMTYPGEFSRTISAKLPRGALLDAIVPKA
jgi:beta-galactosidase